ncbi:MAG: TPM domain-containing protein, partial [Candidatus Marinimicrobia bacterium]|nr:TPM domain-containing protein [Candidatus Neomarinimicrobiota bacterium]
MDQANVLSIDNQLATVLNDYWKKSGVQLAVLTVSDLQGESIEGYSMRVAEAWALGEKGKDKGALLLIAVNDHRVRIEVGYGLEEKLTDYQSGRIIRERITPHFRNNDYDSG